MTVNFIVICAWCKQKVKRDKVWYDLGLEVVQRLGVTISHGVCPHCEEKMQQKLRQEAAERGITLT